MTAVIKTNLPDITHMKDWLEKQLPSYTYKTRGKHILIAKRSMLAAAVIHVKKKRISVSGNFPEFYMSLIFALVTVLLGLIIPVILYFIFIHGKMEKAEKEIAAGLRQEFERSTP